MTDNTRNSVTLSGNLRLGIVGAGLGIVKQDDKVIIIFNVGALGGYGSLTAGWDFKQNKPILDTNIYAEAGLGADVNFFGTKIGVGVSATVDDGKLTTTQSARMGNFGFHNSTTKIIPKHIEDYLYGYPNSGLDQIIPEARNPSFLSTVSNTHQNLSQASNSPSTPNPHERNGVELGDNGQLGGGAYYGFGGATPDGPDGGGQTTTSTTTTTANYGPPGTATSGVNTNRDGGGRSGGSRGGGGGGAPEGPPGASGNGGGGGYGGGGSRGGGNSGGGKPLILDMNRDGLRLSQQHHSMTDFDFDDDGYFERTAWTTGDDDAFLVFDIDNDNAITKAKEIAFAQWTDDPNDTNLEGLAAQFDSNKDGVLDAQDDNWLGFKIWQDSNQNGVVDEQEMKTLEQANINSFTLQRRANTGKAYGDRTIV